MHLPATACSAMIACIKPAWSINTNVDRVIPWDTHKHASDFIRITANFLMTSDICGNNADLKQAD